tara:strand:- start:97964 stop:98278 length:315 start_codon:yes stop_codon:yes gene_type:complete
MTLWSGPNQLEPVKKQARCDIKDQQGRQSFDDPWFKPVSRQPRARLAADQYSQGQRPVGQDKGQEGRAVQLHHLPGKSREGVGQNEEGAGCSDLARPAPFQHVE